MLAVILTQVGKQSGRYSGIFFRLSPYNIADGSLVVGAKIQCYRLNVG
jgi:hypothetical protein